MANFSIARVSINQRLIFKMPVAVTLPVTGAKLDAYTQQAGYASVILEDIQTDGFTQDTRQ